MWRVSISSDRRRGSGALGCTYSSADVVPHRMRINRGLFQRCLGVLVPGHDVSPIVIEQKRPSRDVVKTYFVDRGQLQAILEADHSPDVKDRFCFSDALFATQSVENNVTEREQPRRTRRARRWSSPRFRIEACRGVEGHSQRPTVDL